MLDGGLLCWLLNAVELCGSDIQSAHTARLASIAYVFVCVLYGT